MQVILFFARADCSACASKPKRPEKIVLVYAGMLSLFLMRLVKYYLHNLINICDLKKKLANTIMIHRDVAVADQEGGGGGGSLGSKDPPIPTSYE